MPLLVHGEVTDPQTDIFDREAIFIEQVLRPLVTSYPKLRVRCSGFKGSRAIYLR